jgi:hypothetical protein
MSFTKFKSQRRKPCLFCGKNFDDVNLARIDNEGPFAEHNLVSSCPTCSHMRGNLTLDQWFTQMWHVLRHNDVVLFLPEQLGIQRQDGKVKIPRKPFLQGHGLRVVTQEGERENP